MYLLYIISVRKINLWELPSVLIKFFSYAPPPRVKPLTLSSVSTPLYYLFYKLLHTQWIVRITHSLNVYVSLIALLSKLKLHLLLWHNDFSCFNFLM